MKQVVKYLLNTKILVYLFCIFLSTIAQAKTNCSDALKKPVELDQEAANTLSKAIIEGDTGKIQNLAKPWLNKKDHGYQFSSNVIDSYNINAKSNDILVFTALVAFHANQIGDHAIRSLKTLIEMGFNFSTIDDGDEPEPLGHLILLIRFNLDVYEDFMSINKRGKQIIDILVNAGLTAKKLPLNNGRWNPIEIENIISLLEKSTNYDAKDNTRDGEDTEVDIW